MRHFLAATGLIALAIVTAPTAQATPASLDEIAQSIPDSGLSYAKNKGWKGKTMKRRGPPRWAPAHGLRRKRGY